MADHPDSTMQMHHPDIPGSTRTATIRGFRAAWSGNGWRAGAALFDPADHTVDKVLDHLDASSDAERDRVLAAERAGKNRTTITG